jgi:DNA-binding CsgD family transcriptional regulator
VSDAQLEIIMHLANGKQIDEIAGLTHRSVSNVNYQLGKARRQLHAATLPHLVSIAIGSGALTWSKRTQERSLRS